MEAQDVSPQPPSQEAVILPAKKRLLVFLIIGIFLLFAVGGGVYYLKIKKIKTQAGPVPTQIPTSITESASGWRTVQFKKMGFSLKIPKKWFPHEEEKIPGAGNYETWLTYPVDNPSQQADITGRLIANFSISSYSSDLSLEEWVADYEKNEQTAQQMASNSADFFHDKTEIFVDKKKAIKLTYSNGYVTTVFLKRNKQIYKLTFGTTDLEPVKVFEQILSTFKALDQTATAEAVFDPQNEYTNWKTLISSNCLFYFKYPPEYSLLSNDATYISLLSPLNPKRSSDPAISKNELKIEIYLRDSKEDESLNDFVESFDDPKSPIPTEVLKQEEIRIDGIKAIKQTTKSPLGLGTNIYFLYRNNKIQISKGSVDNLRDKEFEKIISTLKLLPLTLSKRIDANDVNITTLIPANMDFEKKIVVDFNWDGQDEIVLVGKDKDHQASSMGDLRGQKMPLIIVYKYDAPTSSWIKQNEVNYLNFPQNTNYSYIKDVRIVFPGTKYRALVLTYAVDGSGINESFLAIVGSSAGIKVYNFPEALYKSKGGLSPHQVVVSKYGSILVKEGLYKETDSNNSPTDGILQTTFFIDINGINFSKLERLFPPNNLKLF